MQQPDETTTPTAPEQAPDPGRPTQATHESAANAVDTGHGPGTEGAASATAVGSPPAENVGAPTERNLGGDDSTAGDAATANEHDDDASDDEGDDDAEETGEGTESASAATETGAPANGVPGTKPKRRRRRRKKGAGDKAASGSSIGPEGTGAEGATNSDSPATGEASSPGAGAGPKGKRGGPSPKRDADKSKGKHARAKGTGKRPFIPRERVAFPVGEEVFGKVTSLTEHAIMVDLSGKALAIFDRGELAADDLVPDTGDRFVAHIHGDGSRGGLVVLTRKPLREEEAKPRVEAAAKSGDHVLGLVTGVVKGGIEVDIDGLRAFAPASHVDMRLGADLAYLIGQRLEFTVAQYEHRGRDVVVSRKAEVEAEAKETRKAALSKLELGSTVKGVIRTVLPFGMFVSIASADDVEGLVHISEATHDRVENLAELFKAGQEIDVNVLKIEKNGKLWLSHKATIPDPWDEARKTFASGTRHKGKVMRLQPFGAFIEVAPGIEGLLHVSDLSIKRIEHPKELLKEGDEIDVVVAEFDRGSERIALHPAPPAGEENEPRQKIAPHKSVKVAVVATETGGLIVRIIGVTGRQARAYIPAGATGTERGTDLRRHFPVGTKLEAKVIDVDPRRGEAKLSLRAFKEDTEKAAYNEYRASVAKASKFGTLGDLLAKKLS